MSTLDTVFLIITACSLSLFFLLAAVLLAYALKLVKSIRLVIDKAEDAIESVESASSVLRNIGSNAGGSVAIFKVINNILKLVNRK